MMSQPLETAKISVVSKLPNGKTSNHTAPSANSLAHVQDILKKGQVWAGHSSVGKCLPSKRGVLDSILSLENGQGRGKRRGKEGKMEGKGRTKHLLPDQARLWPHSETSAHQ